MSVDLGRPNQEDLPKRLPRATRRLRLGFVGGGRGAFIGEVHAMGARLSNRWEVVAGALSSDPETARQSGADWLLPSDRIYTDYRDMAAAEQKRLDGIDAVAITTPNNSHHAIASAFMERGIDVICDKPLCNTVEQARDLVEQQKRSGLVFAVTYAYASHPMVRQIREMVRAGRVGQIKQIHVEYFQEWALLPPAQFSKGAEWRLDPAKAGETFTTGDIGTHAHHLACFASGLEMTELRAEFHVTGAPKPLEDTAFMQVRFQGGVPGTLMVSQAAAGTHCGLRLRIFGEVAGIEWNQETPEYVHFTPVQAPAQTIMRGEGADVGRAAGRLIRMPRGHPEALTDAWANIYTEFAVAVDARRGRRILPEGLIEMPTVLDGMRGVEFVQAAVQSNDLGGAWVRIAGLEMGDR
jgi:predicted dehydrogenase